jgi:hypothetical protein
MLLGKKNNQHLVGFNTMAQGLTVLKSSSGQAFPMGKENTSNTSSIK